MLGPRQLILRARRGRLRLAKRIRYARNIMRRHDKYGLRFRLESATLALFRVTP